MSTYKIAVIGGDRRQGVLAALYAQEGHEVAVYALDGVDTGAATRSADLKGALSGAAAVILPLPASRDGVHVNTQAAAKVPLAYIESMSEDDALIIGGMVKAEHFPAHRVRDYYAAEDLKLYNTLPTAEGALAIAMNELPTTVHGTKTLIMGFGRVGKSLGLLLKGFGAELWVVTRNPTERAVCEILNISCMGYDELPEKIGEFGLIFNTVPMIILKGELLERIGDGVPVIDLATYPGGADAEAAKAMGKKLIWALALPGKVAPVSAGIYIKKAVDGILKEEGLR